jgi:biotin carboxyl carrier protein
MPLEYSAPQETLARELQEVARDASLLGEYLQWGANINFPGTFPRKQLNEIAQLLTRLPDGTAEGCRAQLEHARGRLAAIRLKYVRSDAWGNTSAVSDSEPSLIRDGVLDQKVKNLIGSITTALHEYRRLEAGEGEDHDEPLFAIVPPASSSIPEATEQSEALGATLERAHSDLGSLKVRTSTRAENFERQLVDATGLNRLARIELTMPTVAVNWFRKTVDALRGYPDLIRSTARTLKIGADILEIAAKRWHDFEKDLMRLFIGQFRKTCDAFIKVADVLEAHRGGGDKGHKSRAADVRSKSDQASDPDIIRAPVSGTISNFLLGTRPSVEIGSQVNVGDILLLIDEMPVGALPRPYEEQMRQEKWTPVVAQYPGRVVKILVKDGQLVTLNEPLIVIEPSHFPDPEPTSGGR